MPPKTATRRERVVAACSVAYFGDERMADGTVRRALLYAKRGESVVLSPQDEARLDSEGALAKVGATREDVERMIEQRIQAYREVRRVTGEAFA